MNFKLLKDSRHCIPANEGTYQWWSKNLGYLPVIWDGVNWHVNGSIVSRETVRYWR